MPVAISERLLLQAAANCTLAAVPLQYAFTASLAVFPNPSANGRFVLETLSASPLLQAASTMQNLMSRLVPTKAVVASILLCRVVDLLRRPAGIHLL